MKNCIVLVFLILLASCAPRVEVVEQTEPLIMRVIERGALPGGYVYMVLEYEDERYLTIDGGVNNTAITKMR